MLTQHSHLVIRFLQEIDYELIAKYFGAYATQCGISLDELMALGKRADEPDEERFNMAVMGLRLAARANGVAAVGTDHCQDWTTISVMSNGFYGYSDEISFEWTLADQNDNPLPCFPPLAIYCFESF